MNSPLQGTSVFARQDELAANLTEIADKIDDLKLYITVNIVATVTTLATTVGTMVTLLNSVQKTVDDIASGEAGKPNIII